MNSALPMDDRVAEHAQRLIEHLTDRGLRADRARHAGTPADVMAVSAQRVDVQPYAGRTVVLLPGPDDAGGLYWHWRRPYSRHPGGEARWFQAFHPATEPDKAAATIAAAIDADVRARARLKHLPAAAGGSDAGFERQLLARTGRPLHLLVHRILALLDSVEKGVEDTVLLHELFRIDHLATRTLRGLERLAVLGGETARQVHAPLPLATVMRQAVAQIEHYSRVRVQVPPPQAEADLPGYAGPEITLLLAELAENATKFSPPDTQVQMAALPGPSGVSIEITDRGLPMSADTYTALNRLLADPGTVSLRDQIIAGPIGLLVVSKLARRHEIQVTLHPVAPEGTQAVVALPATLLKAPRPAAPRSSAVAAPAGTAHAGALPPLTSAAPSPLALPGNAVTPPTASPGTADIAAPPGADDADGLPELPQRRRRRGPQGPAVGVAAGAEDGRQATTEQTAGQDLAHERGPKRGPVPGLLTDFAGAARPRRPADKEPDGQSTE